MEMLGLTSGKVKERTLCGETNAVKLYTGHSYWQIVRENSFTLLNFIRLSVRVLIP